MPYPYETIADDIVRRIQRGEWREGEKLPPLDELERRYPQSRMTLHKALRHLVDRGYLSMTRRRGTYVKAARPRSRVGILTGQQVFEHGVMPFALQVFRHAHAYFARSGMDAQLYTEDSLAPLGLPIGLQEDIERRRLAGLLTVAGKFPWRFMRNPIWKKGELPHVNIGSGPARWNVDIDRTEFLDQAVRVARSLGRRRAAFLAHASHLNEQYPDFLARCRALRLGAQPLPAFLPVPTLEYERYGFELMRAIWNGDPKPDVVITPDDVIAKGVAQAVSTLGIDVPRKLSIVALINRGAPLFYPTPVTSVEVDVEEMVATAGRMLIDQINGTQAEPRAVLLRPVAPSLTR